MLDVTLLFYFAVEIDFYVVGGETSKLIAQLVLKLARFAVAVGNTGILGVESVDKIHV